MIPGDCAVLREDAGVVLHSQTWRKGPPNPGLTVAAPGARPSWPGRLPRGEAQSWAVTRAPRTAPAQSRQPPCHTSQGQRGLRALQGALHGKGLCRRAGSGRSVAAPGSPDVQGKGSAQHPST